MRKNLLRIFFEFSFPYFLVSFPIGFSESELKKLWINDCDNESLQSTNVCHTFVISSQ